MITLENAVSLGMVTVEPWGRGHIVYGADDDMIILEQLRDMGAVWRNGGYYVMNDEAAPLMRQLARESKAAASALAARQALAREQGVRLFDNQRARQQKKITREIADVYESAMREHDSEIKRLAALLQEGKLEGMEAAEWAAIVARRKNTLKELESVYDGLAQGLANAGAAAERLMGAQLMQSAAISRNVAAWQIDNMTGVNVSRFIGHDLASLAISGITSFHGKYDLAAWQGVADKRKARETIKKAVARGLLTGEHPEKIARRIQGIYSGKEAGSPHKRAVRIARTETARVMSEATVETFRAANDRGVKCRQRWDATLDGKTRDSHRKVDGEIREIGEKFSNGLRRVGDGGPADSINCRCCMTPVVDGFKPDAPMRRNNETGELIPYMTYSEWEKTRGVAAVPKPEKKVSVVSIDYDAPVYKDVSKEHADSIAGVVATANPRTRKLYKRFESDFKLVDKKSKRGYFSPKEGGVSLDIDLDASGKRGIAPFSTWFHEFGHMSDYLSVADKGYLRRYASVEYKNNIFGRTIKGEVDDLVTAKDKELRTGFKNAMFKRDVDWLFENRYLSGFSDRMKVETFKGARDHLHDRSWLENEGFYLRLYDEKGPDAWLRDYFDREFGNLKHLKVFAYKAIAREVESFETTKKADLSDILEGATNGSIQAGWGHGKKYWKDQDDYYGVKYAGLAKEAFAELISASMSNPESMKVLEAYLPETVKVFWELLEALENGEIS